MYIELTPSAVITLMKLSRNTNHLQRKLIITALEKCGEIVSQGTVESIASDMIDLSDVWGGEQFPVLLKRIIKNNPHLANVSISDFLDLLLRGELPSDSEPKSIRDIQKLEINDTDGVWAEEGEFSPPLSRKHLMDTVVDPEATTRIK